VGRGSTHRLTAGYFRQLFGPDKFLPSDRTKGIGSHNVQTLSYSSQVSGEERNSEILVNLPVTKEPRCDARNGQALGVQDLQVPDTAVSSLSIGHAPPKQDRCACRTAKF
jgi:hypothetical protein